MSRLMRDEGYVPETYDQGMDPTQNKKMGFNDRKTSPHSPSDNDNDTQFGIVEDHYGGSKIGMTRVSTNAPIAPHLPI